MNNDLKLLAFHCFNGACNPLAIINNLPKAIEGMTQDECRESIEVKIIVGQLSFLLGESIGPSSDVMQAYLKKQEPKEKGF